MDLDLRDRVYITVGSTSGLGEGTARALLHDGARVVIASRDADRVAAKTAELDALHPGRVQGVALSIADPDAPATLVATAMQAWGRIDGLLVSSGGPPTGELGVASDDQWRDAFESVFLGPVRIAREVAPAISDGGCIAFVLSGSAYAPIPGLALSNGLRPGLAMVLKTLSDELAGRVRTVGLVPGRIATARTIELDSSHPEVSKRRNAAIPAGRLGTVEEFANVAAFMLSPAASYVNGTSVVIDGGLRRGV